MSLHCFTIISLTKLPRLKTLP